MYSVIKGKLFSCYTGSVVCTGLMVHKVVKTKEQANVEVQKLMDTDETDLTIIIDLKTGEQA